MPVDLAPFIAQAHQSSLSPSRVDALRQLAAPNMQPADFASLFRLATRFQYKGCHYLLDADPDRVNVVQGLDSEMLEFRHKLGRLHWMATEPDLSRDFDYFRDFAAGEKRLVFWVLGFFAFADDRVMEGLDAIVGRHIRCKEGEYYLRKQSDQEADHAEAYGYQIANLCPTEEARDRTANLFRESEAVAAMSEFVQCVVGMNLSSEAFFVAMAFIEGCLFSSMFAILEYFKARLPGVGRVNEFVVRDEGVHADWWIFLCKRLGRSDPELVRDLSSVVVELGAAFACEALTAGNVGCFSPENLKKYCDYVASGIEEELGCGRRQRPENPFKHMAKSALNRVCKTDFLKEQNTGYQRVAKVVIAAEPSALDDSWAAMT
jgi:ribonucleotide reductase beta subunit family protein with ferritin-like domain